MNYSRIHLFINGICLICSNANSRYCSKRCPAEQHEYEYNTRKHFYKHIHLIPP